MARTFGSRRSRSAGKSIKGVSIHGGWGLLSILIVLISAVLASIQAPDPQPGKSPANKSFFEWLRYPVERNPGLRLPAVPAQLNSISLADDGLHGVAVGDGGTTLSTADGGDTWIANDSGVGNSLYAVHCDATCTQAWAVGSAGTIIATRDGGEHWIRQRTGLNLDVRLRGVHFQSTGQQGWVVGNGGTILLTADGGKTWQQQANSDTRDLLSIYFVEDGKRGWAVGYSGVILGTSDGGKNWKEQDGGEFTLLSVKFNPDGLHGWTVGYSKYHNTILATSDGGDHWLQLKQPEPASNGPVWLTSIDFSSDGRRGWVVRDDGTIFGTTDGGNTWAKQDSGANVYLSDIHFDAQGRRGWAVGASGTILSSSDGGRNWTTRTSSKASSLNSVYFDAAERMGWAVGASGIILATTDGGAHWTAQTSGTPLSLNAVDFVGNGQQGWAVGDNGVIVATSDGGKHWNLQKSPEKVPLYDVHFQADGQLGWAVGSAGVVISTNNGGRDWNARFLRDAPILRAVHFDPQGQQGWVVGTGGDIFASTDGGQEWVSLESTARTNLSALWFSDDSLRGWAVGAAGLIIATSDGGKTWLEQYSGTSADLNDVRFSPDRQSGWVAGENGVILTTRDGGKNWSQADTKVGSARSALAFAENGLIGWAVGYPPALLRTQDGGRTWEPLPWPLSNVRYPAPWFWLILIPAALFLRKAIHVERGPATKGVEAIGTSDAPIGDFDRDRLQFGSLARGISRFLRNTNTQPPLTLAISGDWGSGKSTLMELVCTDLRRFGVRPVWFNAWHHQKEEQLLAALLNAIRDRGLPPVASADGLAFRLRLLFIRSMKNFILAFLVLISGAALVGYLLGHDFSEWRRLWETLNNTASYMSREKDAIDGKGSITWMDVGRLVPQLASGAAALFSIYRGLKAFKVDPAVLLATTAESFKLKDASAQTSFRSKFAEQFEEVTRALPYTMVLVIDDLDRCQPETVLTVMEAVNFLVSSGTCFVMFGMATRKVQAALGLVFDKVARELVDLDVTIASDAPSEVKERTEREQRLAYARDYLEKLINLEIVVPNRADIPPHLLVDASDEESSSRIFNFMEQILEYWPSWLGGAAIALGLLFGFQYTIHREPQSVVNVQKAPATISVTKPEARAQPATPMPSVAGVAPTLAQTANRYVPVIQTNDRYVVDRWAVGATLALFIAVAGGMALFRLRTILRQVRDSEQFHDALRIWMPVVQQRRGTPRALKRFGNRLRYLAMLQQDDKFEESGFDQIRKRLDGLMARVGARAKRSGGTQPNQTGATEGGIGEPLLVALASLYEVYGPEWGSRLQPDGDTNLEAAIRKAIEDYTMTTRTCWPPDNSDLVAFEQLLKGIRLTGGEPMVASHLALSGASGRMAPLA